VDIAINKVGQRDGVERFVLVSTESREVVTVRDVTEDALRRFFSQLGVTSSFLDQCLTRARERYDRSAKNGRPPVSDTAETREGDDLLLELGLEQDAEVH
jgi:hypothetical protein